MKKHTWLYIPLLALSLVSCASDNSQEVIDASCEAIKGLQEVTSTNYTLEVTGHISRFDTFEPPASSYDVPTGVLGDTGYSYIFRTPLLLNEETYYPEDISQQGLDTSQYGYFKITSRLLWTADSRTSLNFEKTDDSLVFSVQGLSKNLTFYHVLTDEENMLYSNMQVYARFDISLTYNLQGLLIEEKIKSQTPLNNSIDQTVDVTTIYTYS